MSATIEIKNKSDFGRLRCPYNHSAVGPTNNHWHCATCARGHDTDIDPEFDRVRDALTGREYTRDQVKIDDTIRGVYYA